MSSAPAEARAGSRGTSPCRVFQAAAAILALAAFLLALREVLNPFILFWVLLVLLLPFRDHPGHFPLVCTAALLTLLWILATTGSLLAPFVLALGLAYVLDPLVNRIEARGADRTPAMLALAVPGMSALLLLVLVGLPALAEQMGEIIVRAPELMERVADALESLDSRLAALTLPGFLEELVAGLRSIDSSTVVAFLEERREAIARRAWSAVLGVGRGLGSALTVLSYVVLTPVLTFYLLRDWDGLTTALGGLVPAARRDAVASFAKEYDHLLSRYLRGQLMVAFLIGAITALGLFLTSFPYAFLLGAIVAVFNVVPYLGIVLSLIPALGIAFLSGSIWTSVLKVAVVFGVAQALEGAVISPRIVGESVGLHPVWVLLAICVGGFYFGFSGLLLAVPLAVGLKLVIVRALERYRETALFRGEGRDGDGVSSGLD